MDERAFREHAERDGYQDPALVDWAADTVNETHAHVYDCALFVLSGELTLATDDGEKTYRAGDTALMARDRRHAERVGPNGVKLLVARK